MGLESWLALGAAVLLAAAGTVRGMSMSRLGLGRERWSLLVAGAECGAAVALAAAYVLAVLAHGEWSPLDLRQMALGLALAALGVHMALELRPRLPRLWRSGMGGAGFLVDLVVLGLTLFAVFLVRPGGPPLPCIRCAVPYYLQWALCLLGVGGVIVAGSTGLSLALRLVLVRRGPGHPLPRRAELHALLAQTALLALVILGLALVVGVGWAWRTVGLLTSDDPREGWVAITWLVVAASVLAWRVDEESGRWPAALAVAAAAVGIFSLLAMPDLYRLLGI